MLNGFINLYKNKDISSNKALSILKYVLKQNNILTKVGHFGTLDPIAEGVLPVALGRATRLFDYSLDKAKTYKAVFEFGLETDTLDRTGVTLNVGRKEFTKEEILQIIPSLVGTVDQIPPIYSAKSIGGERAYKLARNGIRFDLPPKRVEIYDIILLEQLSEGVFSFEIKCGGGTYIRSIARDIAYKLNTFGIMRELIRTSSGPFDVSNAVKIEDLADNPMKFVQPMSFLLNKMDEILLDEQGYLLISTGRTTPVFVDDGLYKVFSPSNLLLGIGVCDSKILKMKTWLI